MKKVILLLVFNAVFVLFGIHRTYAQNSLVLESNFRVPPEIRHPGVWWHWMGNNITADGITSDLEAMKSSGIRSATLFNVSSNADKGGYVKNSYTQGITYQSPVWWELVKHAAEEAERLHLEIGIHNCVGYTGSGGPWITPEKSMQEIVWTSVRSPMPFTVVLPQPATTLGFYRDIAVLAVPEGEPSPDQVIDITSFMDPEGSLNWDVPEGRWIIYRFGHTSTGKRLRPVPEDLTGKTLEADKMSAETMSFHMHQILEPLAKNLGSHIGRSFKHIVFDSFESGDQNWTPKMRDEFLKRRGYNIIPWLPVLAGHNIGGEEKAVRFKWDLNTTVSELMIENAFMLPKRLINEMGMQVHIEPYDGYGGIFNEISAASVADITMVEFWTHNRRTYGGKGVTASAARAAGKKILAAEAFTGDPRLSPWNETPASLKAVGDSAFTFGINSLMLHSWTHQPFPDNIKPGMSFGWWGTHFGRNQTWFEPGKAWFDYIARCQSLLQLGEQVVDFCVLEPKNPVTGGDAISTKMFLNDLSVKNGNLVLKNGRRYSLLMIPENTTMLPEVARKLKQLVSEGAVIIGSRPEKSPSLKDWPDADLVVDAIGKELWGNIDGTSVTEYKFGKGRMIWGKHVSDVLSEMGLPEDLKISGTARKIYWNHRKDEDNDYYFIVNPENTLVHFKAIARVGGKIPELWYPETGKIEDAGIWQDKKEYTNVEFNLKGNESVFLVFRRSTEGTDAVNRIMTSVRDTMFNVSGLSDKNLTIRSLVPGKFDFEMTSGQTHSVEIKKLPEPIEIRDTWDAKFRPMTGVPVSIKFDSLKSWTKSSDNRIKYFSGTATYNNQFTLPENVLSNDLGVMLDLGSVKELAEIKINGQHAGILWYHPFRINITEYVKPGINTIEIAVTNTWDNRLIGDEQFSDDCFWGNRTRAGRSIIEFPDWLIKNQPRPSSDRTTFSSWNYFSSKSPLSEAGLIGPVRLVFEGIVQVN